MDRLNERQDDQERLAILDWLTPINYASQQNDFISRRQAETGLWLLDSTQYQDWLKTSKQTLFCQGIPGAGKTILTSIVIGDLCERFQGDTTTAITYIYFNFRQRDEQKVDVLLASMLRQLAHKQPSLPDSVKDLYKRHKDERTRPPLDEISRALQSVAAVYARVFIVVDALDECQESDRCRSKFLKGLFNLQANTQANLFATSRHRPDIEKEFERSVTLEIRANSEDVRRYLQDHISQLPSCVSKRPHLQRNITNKIVDAVDGM